MGSSPLKGHVPKAPSRGSTPEVWTQLEATVTTCRSHERDCPRQQQTGHSTFKRVMASGKGSGQRSQINPGLSTETSSLSLSLTLS